MKKFFLISFTLFLFLIGCEKKVQNVHISYFSGNALTRASVNTTRFQKEFNQWVETDDQKSNRAEIMGLIGGDDETDSPSSENNKVCIALGKVKLMPSTLSKLHYEISVITPINTIHALEYQMTFVYGSGEKEESFSVSSDHNSKLSIEEGKVIVRGELTSQKKVLDQPSKIQIHSFALVTDVGRYELTDPQ